MDYAAAEQDLALAMASLADELYQLVSSFQRPRLKDSAWAEAARARCAEMSEKVARARAAVVEAREALGERMVSARASAVAKREALGESLERMSETLRTASQTLAERPRSSRWREMSSRLGANYEEVVAHIRSLRDPVTTRRLMGKPLKPINYTRNIFHLGMGLASVLLYEFVLSWPQTMIVLGVISSIALFLEISRRFSEDWNEKIYNHAIFRPISRPRERYRTNGASYYALTLTAVSAFAPMTAVEIGLVVLAFADPAASITGKLWGRRKLWRQKSWVGTSAFAAMGFASILVFAGLKGMAVFSPAVLGMAASCALAGALVELFSDRLDDNFTVLALCTGVAALWL
jgi:dolichol kinase